MSLDTQDETGLTTRRKATRKGCLGSDTGQRSTGMLSGSNVVCRERKFIFFFCYYYYY
jgi:hypothetical protein